MMKSFNELNDKDLDDNGDDNNDKDDFKRVLYVVKQFCMDATGKGGRYTGFIRVDSGLPHIAGGAGDMEYEKENNKNNDNENKDANDGGAVSRYVGEWKDGCWHGRGTCYLTNGDIYVGQFEDHQRNGSGEYRWKQEEIPTNKNNNNNNTGKLVKQRIYSGDFSQNQRHGYGTYTWKTLRIIEDEGEDSDAENTVKVETVSVSTYKGYFEHGLRQGHGVYTSPTVQYTGEWWNGVYHGYGVQEGSSNEKKGNTVYRGYFNNGKREGRGIEVRQDDGSLIFEGLWRQDKPVLNNTLEQGSSSSFGGNEMENRNTERSLKSTSAAPITSTVFQTPQMLEDWEGYHGLYKGIVEQGLPQGVGTMTYEDHETIFEYEGFWQFGVRHGYGRILYRNRDRYEGNFVKNKRHGNGEYTTATGNTTDQKGGRLYKGKFKEDLPNDSDFQVLYPNQDIYQGYYYQGQRYGHGRFEFSSGSYYEGEWELGMYHGSGQLVTEHFSYQGEFSKGVFHGHGCLKDANGNNTLYEGKWIEGRPEQKDAFVGLTKEQLQIAHPPLDDPFSGSDWSDRKTPTGLEAVTIPNLVRKLSPLPTIQRQASVPKGTVLPPSKSGETAAASDDQSFFPASFASSLFGTLTGSTQSEQQQQQKKEEEFKPVVDMQVWDGQDNPGQYTGLLHLKTQRPHGVGRMVYQDGNRIHEGFWSYGHRQGHGRCLFVKIGDFHEGGYYQNLRQGQGKYHWKDGRMYVGNYHLDERHGEGRFVYPNGDVYQGNFEKGQRSGFGTFTFQNRTCRYQGNWKEGCYHGRGKLEWIRVTIDDDASAGAKRHCYEGEFVQGLFHGSGIEMVDGNILRKGLWEKGVFLKSQVDLSAEESDLARVGDASQRDPEIETLEKDEEKNEVIKAASYNHVHTSVDEEAYNVSQPRRNNAAEPKRVGLSAECASSLEQNHELQRLQWKKSLEPGNT